MSYRKRIALLCLALFVTALALAVGSYFLFRGMGTSLDQMNASASKYMAIAKIERHADELFRSANIWIATGERQYRVAYRKNLSAILDSRTEMLDAGIDAVSIDHLASDLAQLTSIVDSVDPSEVDERLSALLASANTIERKIGEDILQLHAIYQNEGSEIMERNRKYKERLTYMMLGLIAMSMFTAIVLLAMVGKALDKPFALLLDATRHVAGGDLSHRIRVDDKAGEFKSIADGFNAMVESLHDSGERVSLRLIETELLLEATSTMSGLKDLAGAFDTLTSTIPVRLKKDACAVLLADGGGPGLLVKSAYPKSSSPDRVTIPQTLIDDVFGSQGSLGPILIERYEEVPELFSLFPGIGRFVLVPILAEQSFRGMLVIGTKGLNPLGTDEEGVLMLLAYAMGSALRASELQSEARRQMNQLIAINDLNKVITSIYEPSELMSALAARIALLLKARLCVLRLIEGDALRYISSYGEIDEQSLKLAIPVGKGMVGHVAETGVPLIIDDLSTIADDPGFPRIVSTKTALCVPLMKDNRAIGVITLYDKLDGDDGLKPFTAADIALAEGLASVSAVAIEKALTFEAHERVRLEKLKSEKRLELLFESVRGGIVTLDREYRITSANRFIERWINVHRDEIIGKNAMDVFHAREGICPHCAAKVTFEEGAVNSITQSMGLNYAELSSYPSHDEKGEMTEAVVFVQDITDRVLYQEEIMGLYREVLQNKEYIESFIKSSADAIVTSNLDGMATSWNPAAEEIYGFRNDEVIGRPIPYIPSMDADIEVEGRAKLRRGEVVKGEAFRRRKDGSFIEVSLSLSPIKDVAGEVIGFSCISRDITDRRRVERELIRRNQELSRLFFISSATRGTMDLDVLIRMVLSAVTMGDGLGFNRAMLLLYEPEGNLLKAYRGIGPLSHDEAMRIWSDLSHRNKTLHDILRDIEEGRDEGESFISRLGRDIVIPLSEDTLISRVAREKRPLSIEVGKDGQPPDMVIVEILGSYAYAAVPLISRDRVTGVLWVDNRFNLKSITEDDLKFLTGFADQVASAVEGARLFKQVSLAEAELENIFSSISDMVFLTSSDYTIRNVNQAVVKKIGSPREQIIGKKCYEVFHGTTEPWPLCPHHRTVERLEPQIEEVEDPRFKDTFITSTAPMFDRDGAFIGTVHVMRNISELKALRERLQSSERMAALGEVAARVAHEIRNPLVSVGGFARRLESRLDGNLKESATIIAEEVGRLERILKEILGFAREVRLHRRIIDLNDIVRGVVELLAPEFEAAGNRIELSLDQGGLVLNIDPDRFREVIMNIVTNANLSTSHGGIFVRTYHEGGMAVFETEDTGTGIKEEDMGKIFDPFYTTRPKGTGLGLAVSKRIVEETRGWIHAENRANASGAIFRVYLPLEEARNENPGG